MNFGCLTGFTKKNLPGGESYPTLKVKYVYGPTYKLSVHDKDTIILRDYPTACTVTLDNTISPSSMGDSFHICQWGAGQVTVNGVAPISIRNASSTKTRTQYSVISLVNLEYAGPQPWLLFGDME